MMYALNLAENNRILSATYPEFAPKDAILVDTLPEGNIVDYLYVNGEFVHEPLPVESQISESISQEERIAALEAALLELMGVTVDG